MVPPQVREAVGVLVADEFFREILVDEVVKGIDAVSRQVCGATANRARGPGNVVGV